MSWERIVKTVGRGSYHGKAIKFRKMSPSHTTAALTDILNKELRYITFFEGLDDDAGKIFFKQTDHEDSSTYKLIYCGEKENRYRISCMAIARKFNLNKIFVEFIKHGDGFVGKLSNAKPLNKSWDLSTKEKPITSSTPRIPKEEIKPEKKIPIKSENKKQDPASRQPEIKNESSEPIEKQNSLLERNLPVSKHAKLLIRFGSRPMCRLSAKFGIDSKGKDYIRVERVPGQKELRVWFTLKPGNGAFRLSKGSAGVLFSCAAFIKLHSLNDKTIEFESDVQSGFYYGSLL